MTKNNDDLDDQLVEDFLRFLRGRGPRPSLDNLSPVDRSRHEQAFDVLEAIVDSDLITLPSIEDDPIANRLAAIGRNGTSNRAHERPLEEIPTKIADPLRDIAERLEGDLSISSASGNESIQRQANGLLPWAECQSLGERILVCSTDYDLGSPDVLSASWRILAALPYVTALAVVTTAGGEAVIVARQDCARSVDPVVGWVGPAIVRAPEPLEIALGRYLDASIPRWDRVATLEELRILADVDEEIANAVKQALETHVKRRATIHAKKRALLELSNLKADRFAPLVREIQSRRLDSDQLLERLKDLSKEAPS